jgi:hypothetical protein
MLKYTKSGEPKIKHHGRKKGTPNRVTLDVRECYLEFVEGNLPKLQERVQKCHLYY